MCVCVCFRKVANTRLFARHEDEEFQTPLPLDVVSMERWPPKAKNFICVLSVRGELSNFVPNTDTNIHRHTHAHTHTHILPRARCGRTFFALRQDKQCRRGDEVATFQQKGGNVFFIVKFMIQFDDGFKSTIYAGVAGWFFLPKNSFTNGAVMELPRCHTPLTAIN